MNTNFQYADLHCHPNLKTYGHSYDKKKKNIKKDVWYRESPSFFTKLLNVLLGITRFSQSDFTTMSKGGAKLIFATLYPFEKGFFINSAGKSWFSAFLSDLITGIGYERVRNLQQHNNYFEDLEKEYQFFCGSRRYSELNLNRKLWKLVSNKIEFNEILKKENEIAVILGIEGAHVFNAGLSKYGRETNQSEILENIHKVKQWKYPPLYITFAHNFYNDLCGHAESLEPIKMLVDQTKGINTGFTPLGKTVIHELLSAKNGKPIYIDIKHMSLKARLEYFEMLKEDYLNKTPPTIVSHGAVNGLSIKNKTEKFNSDIFYASDINFYDEEIIEIGSSRGLFAVQFDARRIGKAKLVKKNIRSLFNKEDPTVAVLMIWEQIKHIAEVLDKEDIFAWGTACIGSDYDGTIDPLPGVWTAEYFHTLYEGILDKASNYMNGLNNLKLKENRSINPKEITDRFFMHNMSEFVQNNL